jgi:HPt (histidine-containing phosphotransfer) domain-containing protein
VGLASSAAIIGPARLVRLAHRFELVRRNGEFLARIGDDAANLRLVLSGH